MRKLVCIAFSLLAASFVIMPLSAQKGGKGNGGPGHEMGGQGSFAHLNMMQDKLGLTNDQVDKMYKIQKDYMEKFYQNRNNADKVKELRDKQREEMEKVLTPEQKSKWNSFGKDHDGQKGKDKHQKDKNPPAHGPQKDGFAPHMDMQKDLGLSNEQSDKIFKIHKDYMDKFYQNRRDDSKIKELRAKQISEIQNVLTAEQKAKLDELQKKHNGSRDHKDQRDHKKDDRKRK